MHSFVTLLLVKGAKTWFWALTFEHTNFCDTDQILTSLAEVHHPDSTTEAKHKLGDSEPAIATPNWNEVTQVPFWKLPKNHYQVL